MMYRFLLFAYRSYEESGGMADLALTFNTVKELFKKNYDLDHFVPWSFVSHNLLWNLLPADSSINSSKSNNLPLLDEYLRPFAKMQQQAIKAIYPKNPNNKILEDYLTLHDSISDMIKLSENDFLIVFQKIISL